MGKVLKRAAKAKISVERGNAVFFEGEKALALVRDVKDGDVTFFDRSSIALADLAARVESGKATIYEN